MKTFELKAEPRQDLGKKAVKALRAEGKIPAILNGGKIIDPIVGPVTPIIRSSTFLSPAL